MLFSMLQEAARRGADRIALATSSGRATYGQLSSTARGLAHLFEHRGVVAGSRLCFVGEDPAQFAACFFAAASLGAITVVDRSETGGSDAAPGPSGVEFAVIPASATAAVLSAARRLDVQTISIPSRVPCTNPEPGSRLRQVGSVFAETGVDQSHYVLRSQSNLGHEARSLVGALSLESRDRVLCTMPLERSPGLCVGLLAVISAGASLAFCPPGNRACWLDTLGWLEPTVLITDRLALPHSMGQRSKGLDKVRVILSPRSELIPQAFDVPAHMPGKLATFYHHAETGVIALNTHGGGVDCVGRPLPGVQVFLERGWGVKRQNVSHTWSFGSFVCLRSSPRIFLDESLQVNEPGVSGRIVVESPAAAAAVTRNGRYYTADHGYFDADGDLHLLPCSSSSSETQRRCA